MTLISLLKHMRLLEQQNMLIQQQAALIEKLERELNTVRLDSLREQRGMIGAWLISIEQPEIDVRTELAQLDNALGNRIATLEEHIV